MRLEDEITLSITLTNSGSSSATIRGDIVTFDEDCLIMICPMESANFNYYRGDKKINFSTNAGQGSGNSTVYPSISEIKNNINSASASALTEIGVIPLVCSSGRTNGIDYYGIIVPVKAGDRIEVYPWLGANSSQTIKLKYKPITLY